MPQSLDPGSGLSRSPRAAGHIYRKQSAALLLVARQPLRCLFGEQPETEEGGRTNRRPSGYLRQAPVRRSAERGTAPARLFSGSTSTGLWKVSASGGKPVPLTALDASRHERQHELPSFLPDGKHFLYLRASAVPEESGIFEGSLDDPPAKQSRKRIVATGLGAYYAQAEKGAGRLLFLNGDVLMAQPFDPAALELSGEPAPVARGVGSIYQTGYFSVSPETLTYRTSASIRDYQLTWFDRQGKPVGTAGEPGSIANVRVSPDGTRAAYRKDSFNLADQDIWLLDLGKGSSSRFTFGRKVSDTARNFRSGRRIAAKWSSLPTGTAFSTFTVSRQTALAKRPRCCDRI